MMEYRKVLEDNGFTEHDGKWWKGDYRLHQPKNSKGWWIMALVGLEHGQNLRWCRFKTLAAALRAVDNDVYGSYREAYGCSPKGTGNV